MKSEIRFVALLGAFFAGLLWVNVILAQWVYGETLAGQALLAFALSGITGDVLFRRYPQ